MRTYCRLKCKIVSNLKLIFPTVALYTFLLSAGASTSAKFCYLHSKIRINALARLTCLVISGIGDKSTFVADILR